MYYYNIKILQKWTLTTEEEYTVQITIHIKQKNVTKDSSQNQWVFRSNSLELISSLEHPKKMSQWVEAMKTEFRVATKLNKWRITKSCLSLLFILDNDARVRSRTLLYLIAKWYKANVYCGSINNIAKAPRGFLIAP